MVRVGSYCIDRYEAYVVDVGDDGSESAHSPYEQVAGLSIRAKVGFRCRMDAVAAASP
jgi:hypothetical protein